MSGKRQAGGGAEQRLEGLQRDASVGQLAAGVAHDLNNVLATISVLSTMLRGAEDGARRAELLAQIDAAVVSASLLTRGLLDYGRRGPPDLNPVALGQVVRDVTQLIGRAAGSRLELRLDLRSEQLVLGDPSRLAQVVMNLAINARDAIEGQGSVTFSTFDVELTSEATRGRPPLEPGRYVGLEVTDSGPGIDPALRERIFEPYFTTKLEGAVRGTGLGLSTARRIVTQHRGHLEVVPGVPGGATLRAYFPRAPSSTR
ncbi:MAG: sensor histidine kinase [Myxococcaceae bacterium]